MALKLGTENRKKAALAAGLGLVVLILLVRFVISQFIGDGAPVVPVAVTAPPPATGSTRYRPPARPAYR
jgi:hypothetical protein